MNHPIKKGPEGGRFQCGKSGARYLLDKPVKVGPNSGKFQVYDGGKRRYLLKTKKK